ncbi:uncharacterized protein N7496_011950 [Penicillium cataractarum]|uniref:Uncharacterized protein n=1 Tax=Penicillium cataractarum TaxID=2100454 RepID=A0A9W9RGD7_9EURO|nr:uncharacterized protein N7496_011950 [Penicillium cataractarum]KAJ5359537.1 hypothetical protein N7496_011950 [Penicillium cataractarum]
MSDQNFHTTRQDLRKAESRIAQHGGNNPSDSKLSQMKVIHGRSEHRQVQADRPGQGQPASPRPAPVASDWNSSDQRTVNVGSGGIEGPISGDNDTALRGPATAGSSARVDGAELHKPTAPLSNVGRQRVEGLESLPADATTR